MNSLHGRNLDTNRLKFHAVFLWQFLWVEGYQPKTAPTILEVIDQLRGYEREREGYTKLKENKEREREGEGKERMRTEWEGKARGGEGMI